MTGFSHSGTVAGDVAQSVTGSIGVDVENTTQHNTTQLRVFLSSHLSDFYDKCEELTLPALLLTVFGAAAQAALAQQDVVPGIRNYEVEILKPSQDELAIQDDGKNSGMDVSDCGLVVGRVRRSGGFDAFVWSWRSQFGLAARSWTALPLPDPDPYEFADAEALDVSEFGVVVGGFGDVVGFVGSGVGSSTPFLQRGAVWRLNAAGGISATIIEPPPGFMQNNETTGEVGGSLLEAIAADPPFRAVGYAKSKHFCAGNSGPKGRPGAMVVEFAPPPNQSVIYSTDPASDASSEAPPPKARPLGVSRQGEFIVGAQPGTLGCEVFPECGKPTFPTRWMQVAGLPNFLQPHLLLPLSSETEPPQLAELLAEVRAVTADGVAIGQLTPFDNSYPCPTHAFVWELASDPLAPITVSLLPASDDASSIGYDIEKMKWCAQNGATRNIAVGDCQPIADGPISGAIWFSEPVGDSGAMAWARIDVNAMIAGVDGNLDHGAVVSQMYGVHVTGLRGVNQWGDCVGIATIDTDTTSVRYPVLLRAVRLLGDLDHDGVVDAPDLAILLNAWCEGGCTSTPTPAADFNRDGDVGAADLGALLNAFGTMNGDDPDCSSGESQVPVDIAAASKEKVIHSIEWVGLLDIEGYRIWAATAPAPLRQIIDEVIWQLSNAVE